MLEVSALNAYYGKSHILRSVEFNVKEGGSLVCSGAMGSAAHGEINYREVSPQG